MIQVAERTHAARRRLAGRQASVRIDRWKARWGTRGPARPGYATLQVPKAAPSRLWAALACCVVLGACLAGGVAVWQANPENDDANLQEATGVEFNSVAPAKPAFAPQNPAFAPPKPVVAPAPMVHVEEPATRKLGTFRVTAYCPCKQCCGKWALLPASERPPLRGPYVAADLRLLPKGSHVYIQGVGWRTVSDTGSDIYGRRLDVLMPSHHKARHFGKKWRRVKVLVRDN